ncbi:MAG TPA: CopD family protein [Burkholderiales bacterium]|nr:CopD family protein [Burkholderiales bacterium]
MRGRPVAAELLQPPQRLLLWAGVFGRFFPWVWAAIALILSSGLYMIMRLGGFQVLPWSIHAMFGTGVLMVLIFFYVYFSGFSRLKHAVKSEQWKSGGEALASIRKLIAFNLSLGLLEIVFAAAFRL